MVLSQSRKLVRLIVERPSLGSAVVHASGMGVRLLFIFVLLFKTGPVILGRFGLLASIEVVAVYLAGFEFHAFTTRRYAKHPSERSLRLSLACHRRMLMISTPLAAIGSAVAVHVFGVGLTAIQTVLFCIVIAAGTVTQEAVRFIVLTGRPFYSVAIGTLRTALWQPFALPFLFLREPLQSILVIWMIGAVMSSVWGLWLLRRGLSLKVRPKRRYLIHGIWVARRFYATASATVLQGNLERFVLQTFLGPAAVGIYSFFQNIANALPGIVQSAVVNLWLPQLLNQFGLGREERFETLRRMVKRTLVVGLAVGAGIACTTLILAVAINRQNYLDNSWILFALLLAQILLLWTQPLYLALYGAHQDRAIMWLSLIMLGASLLLSIALISTFGLLGAAASQVIGAAAAAVLRTAMFRLFVRRGLV